nr:hypothetical protein [Verticiella sediminum]
MKLNPKSMLFLMDSAPDASRPTIKPRCFAWLTMADTAASRISSSNSFAVGRPRDIAKSMVPK